MYARPRSAFPPVCCVCGETGDLGWHRFGFEFYTPASLFAIVFGVLYTVRWRMELPACGRCRARARRAGPLMFACASAGAVASVAMIILSNPGPGILLGLLKMLAPAPAGFALGAYLRKGARPRVIESTRHALTIAVPGRGPLPVVSVVAAEVTGDRPAIPV